MSETQQQNQNSIGSVARSYNDFNALKIRLDTTPIISDIELFLRGARIIIEKNDETGVIRSKKVPITKGQNQAKANDSGIHSILNWISATINSQTVQGNFPADNNGFSPKYDAYIYEYHIELTKQILLNSYNWEISEDEINGIVEFIMLLIIPFMSRLIDNKERESYAETFKTLESNTFTGGKNGGLPLINS